MTSVASFLLILQPTCPFRFLSLAFNISRAPCLDIFSSLRNCFRFCSSFNSYFLPLSEKNSFARSWSCFWLHFPWPSVGLPPSFLVCWIWAFILVFIVRCSPFPERTSLQTPSCAKQQMDENKNVLLSTHQPVISFLSLSSANTCLPHCPWCQDKVPLVSGSLPFCLYHLSCRGVRLHFYSCRWSKKILWWNLWQN